MAEPTNAAPLTASQRIKGAAFTYMTLLRDFSARSPFTVGFYVFVELTQVAFQSAIGLFILLFLRKVGGDDLFQFGAGASDLSLDPAQAVASSGIFQRLNELARSPQALMEMLSTQLGLSELLFLFLVLVAVAALSTFAASYLLNRRARQYEDFVVRRALTRLSNIGFSELASLRRWMPVDRNSAFKLIQTDARMTAMSARLLVYAFGALGLLAVVLIGLTIIDWRVAFVAVALLVVSTAPILVLMVFGSRHSEAMLERAPDFSREKQRLLDVALVRPQRLEEGDADLAAAFVKGGAISRFMDTFETRFQILSIGGFIFNLVTNLVLVAILLFLLTEVLTGRLDPALLVLFFVVVSLLVRAFRQVANFMTTVSRLHVPTETHQRFIAATQDRTYANRTAASSSKKPVELPVNSNLHGVKAGASLKPGGKCAVMSREPISRFWAYEFCDLVIENPESFSDVLDQTAIFNEIEDLEAMTIRQLVGAQRGFFANDYKAFKVKVQDIWSADRGAAPLQPRDWPPTMDVPIGSCLAKPGLANLVRVLGAAHFSGSILFLHAGLLKDISSCHLDTLLTALGPVIVFFFDRRPRPDLFLLRSEIDTLFIKTAGRVSAFDPKMLDERPQILLDKMVAQETERREADDDLTMFDAV